MSRSSCWKPRLFPSTISRLGNLSSGLMGGLKRNETVLIHSVGGGVGIAATQIAKHLGARVIGTTSASKHAELRATEDFEKRAREITNGRGVELILDAVGDLLKKGHIAFSPQRDGSACSAFPRQHRSSRPNR